MTFPDPSFSLSSLSLFTLESNTWRIEQEHKTHGFPNCFKMLLYMFHKLLEPLVKCYFPTHYYQN